MARSEDYVSTFLDVDPRDLDPEAKRQPQSPGQDTPFRIAILGDFSGRSNRGLTAEPRLRGRKPIPVDLDNFDELCSRLGVQIELPGPDAPVSIRFESVDDFHPDSLYQNVPLFQKLRRVRQEVLDQPTAPRRPSAPSIPEALPSALNSGSLLDDIVGGAEAPAAARRRPDAWQQMIEGIVAPHLTPKPDARSTELAGRVTETINLAMRVLLHHPDFQDLEAAWRSVDFLLRRLETAAGVEISLIDLSKQELLADLGAAPRSTGLYRLLVDDAAGTAGETPWAVVAGLYTFEPRAAEIRALAAIASIAQDAGAPFLSSIGPRLLGSESFAAQPDPEDWTARLDNEAELEWNKLRQLPEARWIGLAAPRFLLRQPYGRNSIDLPGFEEMAVPPDPADHLWANPAVACVALIAESFLADGWEVPLRNTTISGLPVHTYKADGESIMTPCAECWMSERLAERFLDRGIMPLASMKGRDAVKLIRLQSIATPVSRLQAHWG